MRQPLDLSHIEVPDDITVRFLRKRSLPERLALVAEANRMVRRLIRDRIRKEYPEWDHERVSRELASRLLNLTECERAEVDEIWRAHMRELAHSDSETTGTDQASRSTP
jgi:hypothetical protein